MHFLRLVLFYFTQGLRLGLQVRALPAILADRGVSYSGISLSLLLALPFSLKLFDAPLVDRYSSARLGRRRSCILPLSAFTSFIDLMGGATAGPPSILPLVGTIFFLNVSAAL